MRKVIFAILAVVLLIFTGFVIYSGTNIGKFEVWGIKQINEENDKIDSANADLGTLVNVSYPDAVTKLTNSGETMEETKREYEEQVAIASSSRSYLQTEKYKPEFLWTKIGNYGKDYKVTPKMQISNGSTNEVYNVTISAVGKYANIASFIYAIENDSRLGFKIEDFKMVQSTDGQVEGTFTCKEIRIDLKSLDRESTDNGKTDTNNSNTGNTNNTNTNSSSSTRNTTNTTNTNSTSTSGTTNTNTTGNTNTTNNSTNTNGANGSANTTNANNTSSTDNTSNANTTTP